MVGNLGQHNASHIEPILAWGGRGVSQVDHPRDGLYSLANACLALIISLLSFRTLLRDRPAPALNSYI